MPQDGLKGGRLQQQKENEKEMENNCENNSAVKFLVTREINYSLLLNADSKALKSKWKLKLDRDCNRHTNLLIFELT